MDVLVKNVAILSRTGHLGDTPRAASRHVFPLLFSYVEVRGLPRETPESAKLQNG